MGENLYSHVFLSGKEEGEEGMGGERRGRNDWETRIRVPVCVTCQN